jgi:putative intracellular protease/amidase
VASGALAATGRALAAPAVDPARLAEAMRVSEQAHTALMEVPGLVMHGAERIAMLVYPGFTALDLVGPQYFFASLMGAKVDLVAKTLEPVKTDTGFAVLPTATFADVAPGPTVLFVPGGTQGTIDAMADDATVDFLAATAKGAAYVTSVCTGSLLLGMAGLLEGKRATGHWVTRDLLARFGAIPEDRRVVQDGNIVTGAGVSAGLDFALTLVKTLRGMPYAQALALQAEYAPEPPLPPGTMATTPPAIAEPMRLMFSPLVVKAESLAPARRG